MIREYVWALGTHTSRPQYIELTPAEQQEVITILRRAHKLVIEPDRVWTEMMTQGPLDTKKVYAFKLSTNDYWQVTANEAIAISECIGAYRDLLDPIMELEQYKLMQALETVPEERWLNKLDRLYQFCLDAAKGTGFVVQ